MNKSLEFWKGLWAREESIALHHNPHDAGGQDHLDWEAGWHEGNPPRRRASAGRLRRMFDTLCEGVPTIMRRSN